jgi:CRISPR-associated protein Csd2
MNNVVANRHDILILFDVTNGNPNGDPDAGNMPRIEPNTNKGIVSDVCLKRKIRNYVELFPATRTDENSNAYNVLIKQGSVIETEQKRAIAAVKDHNAIKGQTLPERVKYWICREFYDVRTFGCVISTGDEVMKGSAFGQIRGPVQITFGQSFHPITPLEASISVCAARNEAKGKDGKPPTEDDIAKSIVAQTGIQGRKHFVPYALYAAKCYISPPFAEKTGFSENDLSLFFEALNEMFTHDRSASRGEMVVRGIYDFEHVGTQHSSNAAQNQREARLGCYHAHKLFERIQVALKPDKAFPESFEDYKVDCRWDDETLPLGVVLHLRHELPCRSFQRTAKP